MFNKSLFSKENEDNKNIEFTEEDYDQINKEISKALSEMKKEKLDNDDNGNEEDIDEAEPNKELNNFDYDFFSENSNSISNDNISDILDNSFKSANVEMSSNNSLKINMIKSDFKTNNKNNNNNNNNNFSGITKEGSTSSNEFNGSLKRKKYSFNSMENEWNNNNRQFQNNNLNGQNYKKSFNSSPYLLNLSNDNIFNNNYLNDSGFNNPNNINNSMINLNIQNNQNMQVNNQPMIINNLNNINLSNQQMINNNINYVNQNNNFFNNNNPLNNMNIINCNNNINNNQFLMNNNNNNFFSYPTITERGVPGLYNLDSPKNIINLDNILKSRDKRTTLIIRNIIG